MVAHRNRRVGPLLACAVVALLATCAWAADNDVYRPRKMQPTPPDKLRDIGTERGMPLYPAKVPGFPGMDPDVPGREPRNTPMYLPYPGAVEFYSRNAGYHPKILPYNLRTLVHNFKAVDLPGVSAAAKETFAQPEQWLKPGAGWWCDYVHTGNVLPPEPVVRLKPGGERLKLHIGPLATSMYVLRVVAAIETKEVLPYPKDLVLDCRINDGPRGEVNHYVLRNRGTDNFYDVGNFFFHVIDGRSFDADIGIHPDSQIDLLVYNVDLHDVLGECARRAGKTASIEAPLYVLASNWKTDPAAKLKPAKAGDWNTVYDQRARDQRLADLRKELPGKDDAELLKVWRERRDEQIWNNGPPINVNLMGDDWGGVPIKVPLNYSKVDPETEKMMVAKGMLPEGYKQPGPDAVRWNKLPFGYEVPNDLGPWRLVDPKTKEVVYTLDDLRQNKPYPGLPWSVHTWGRRFPSDIPGDAERGEEGFKKAFFFSPLAQAAGASIHAPRTYWEAYVRSGDMQTARDMALKLVRWSYFLPNLDPNKYLSRLCAPSVRAHLRWMRFYQYLDNQYLDAYDQLFTFIQGNQELADAVRRFIPWVETPEDVVTLLDTYQIQYLARQMQYWRQNWYSHGSSGSMAKVAAIQMDPEITRPWVESIFTRTHEYPYFLAGIQDLMYMSIQRDGTSNIGSSYYTFGASLDAAKWLKTWIANGGDPKYDLTDPGRYPRVTAGLYWMIDGWVAGMHHMAVGDVGGFYRYPTEWVQYKVAQGGNPGDAWRWTKDPRFAWLAVNFGKRTDETDAEWAEMVKVAAGMRNPYMANTSRVMVDWGGILEGGRQSDDFRFRHALRVRVGYGTGHAHADTLGFAFWSLGIPLNISPGARGGYSYPSTNASYSHNVVTVDGKSFRGYSWVQQLADMGKCQYLSARALYAEEFRRQVALIELDEGVPAKTPPSTKNLLLAPFFVPPGAGTKFDKNITFPRAYAIDVFRVAGGREHMYNFHGFPDDDFQLNVTPGPLSEDEKEFMKGYTLEEKGAHWGGTENHDELVATWELNRTVREFVCPSRPGQKYIAHRPNAVKISAGAEQWMMGSAYDPDSPRKYLRVHLFGQKGSRVLTGTQIVAPYGVGRTDGEFDRQVHVIHKADGDGAVAASRFLAVWEPYAGKPVIKSIRAEGDPNDPHSFAAAHVETVDGIRDICYIGPDVPREQTLDDGARVEADFAYVSRDAQGLRRVSLAAGRCLQTPEVTLEPATTQYQARVVSVDYIGRVVTLDRAWPAGVLDGTFFEVGSPQRGPHAAHWTTFQGLEVTPDAAAGRTRLRWRKGADVFSGEVAVIPKKATYYAWQPPVIETTLAAPVDYGENTQLVLTAPGKPHVWRCDLEVRGDYKGDNARNGRITLYDAPFRENVTGADGKTTSEPIFKPGDRVQLWAFGAGDIWRAPTKLTLRRTAPGQYVVEGNVGGTLCAPGAQWSTDGAAWKPIPADGLKLTAEQAGAGTVRLRLPAEK